MTTRKKFRPYQPDQLLLLPPSLRDWLPEDHVVYFLSDAVEEMDLSAIYASYAELRGQPPYEPSMMVKVLLYGYMLGIRSSRKLERALHEDVGFRVLSCNQQPDFWTIAAFRRRHHEALGGLLGETVRLGMEAGLIKGEHVSVDGTKIKAHASRHSAMSYGRMDREETRLQRDIEEYFADMEAQDRLEDEKFGDRRGDELPEHLSTRKKRVEAIRRARESLEAKARQRAEEESEKRRREAESEGRVYHPRKDPQEARPRDKDQYNFTDPESRIMKSSEGSFIQAYNGQALVDTDSMMIIAGDLSNQAADSLHLLGLVAQYRELMGCDPKELSADAGYYSEAILARLQGWEVEAFIPPDKIKHSEWRTMTSPRGRIPKDATRADLMRRKLRTKRGRARYRKRQCSVEPVFGHIKEVQGFRQLLLRGQAKARSMWQLVSAAHNLWKLYRKGGVPEAIPGG